MYSPAPNARQAECLYHPVPAVRLWRAGSMALTLEGTWTYVVAKTASSPEASLRPCHPPYCLSEGQPVRGEGREVAGDSFGTCGTPVLFGSFGGWCSRCSGAAACGTAVVIFLLRRWPLTQEISAAGKRVRVRIR